MTSIDFDRIPDELKKQRLWVLHIGKIPYTPQRQCANTTDATTWSTFDSVTAAYHGGGFDGIGFVLAGGFWGADFDGVLGADGHFLEHEIEQEVRTLAEGAYVEISISGTGVHVIGEYRGNPVLGRKAPITNHLVLNEKKKPQREGYVIKRYFTITGTPVAGIPSAAPLKDTTAKFFAWRTKHFGLDTAEPSQGDTLLRTTMRGKYSLDDLTSEEQCIVETHQKDPKFAALWDGNDAAYLNDTSRADQAFFNFLAKDCRDATRLEVIGRCSARYRSKWDENKTYLPRTIKKALHNNPTAQDVFQPVDSAMGTDSAQGNNRGLHFELLDDVAPTLDRPALVKELLDLGAMSVLYGESNSGKTFVALSLAFAIAANLKWMDRSVQSGLVVYVAAEGGSGIRKRLAALRVHHGEAARGAPLALVPCPIDLSGPGKDVDPLLDLIQEAVEKTNCTPILVVIDTLSRALGGANENAPDDMTAFIKNVDRLRTATQAHVLVVHHTGKDRAKGARGHSSLRAATDTELEIADNIITVTKQRDMDQGLPIGFQLDPVVIGKGVDGALVSSCVVISHSLTKEHGVKRISPKSVAGRAFDVLGKLTIGLWDIPIQAWKNEFINSHYPKKPKSGWNAFERARKTLREAGATVEKDGRVSYVE